MAKFKKKKSQPTPEPEDSKKESIKEEPVDIPETEQTEPVPESPSKDPSISEAEKSEKDRKLNKLFWMRVALAIIAGTAATFIFEGIEGEERRWASIAFMIIIFFGTIIVAKGMKISKNIYLYGFKNSDLKQFDLANIELLISKNLIQNKLIKPIYLS